MEKYFNTTRRQFTFFDIGCGAGNYAYRYKRLTDKKFGSYRGLDHKSYDINNEFEIIIDDAENSFKYISEETNIVVSQSALEHVQRDLLTVNKITEALTSQNKKFLQIHLVPASSSIFLYLWHGWRQYSKKSGANFRQFEKRLWCFNYSSAAGRI